MKTLRNIVQIDESRCNGCGQCVIACAEGAIAIIDGKAKIVADLYCDGLGACIGDCPMDALAIIQRDAEPFNEEAVQKRLNALFAQESKGPSVQGAACGVLAMNPAQDLKLPGAPLTRPWPFKLGLTSPESPALKGATLVLAADCSAFAWPQFHQEVPADVAVLIMCPKFESREKLVERLTAIFYHAKPKACIAIRMEVPCCSGVVSYVQEATLASGVQVPLHEAVLTRGGTIWTGGKQGISHLFAQK